MLVAKTYYVTLASDTPGGPGSGGIVKRLDNFTGLWQDVSLPLSLPNAYVSLYDVETDPTNGNKVFTVGAASYIHGYFGIYVSNNEGITWQIPSGNYQTIIGTNTNRWIEVTVVDSNTIYICGTGGYICKSIDGGLSFNLCTNAPALPISYHASPTIQDCNSIHFITPLAGVVGMNNNTIITSDGGVTWTPCCGGNGIENSTPGLVNPGKITGIHLDITSQIIVAQGTECMMRSINAAVNFSNIYSWSSNNSLTLTWENDLRLWAMGSSGERIRTVDGGISWTILSAYSLGGSAHNAAHFYLSDNGFVSANKTLLLTTDGGVTGLVSNISTEIITAVWTYYSNVNCYLLSDCNGIIPPFIVNNNLGGVVGQTVQICTSTSNGTICNCFIVSTVDNCNEAIDVIITASFPDCVSCNYCYILTDCTNSNNVVITGDNLSQYVGSVVQLADCPDTCWYVTKSHDCPNPVCVSDVIAVFESCITCLPQPIILPVPDLNYRRIKPGYTTPGCDPEYTETVNCVFSKAVYDKMIIDRYGVTMCCNEDVQKWDIKKQLLELSSIFDPSLCKSGLNRCCSPCDVVAEILAFSPISCPAPISVISSLILQDMCPAPGVITNIGIIID